MIEYRNILEKVPVGPKEQNKFQIKVSKKHFKDGKYNIDNLNNRSPIFLETAFGPLKDPIAGVLERYIIGRKYVFLTVRVGGD